MILLRVSTSDGWGIAPIFGMTFEARVDQMLWHYPGAWKPLTVKPL